MKKLITTISLILLVACVALTLFACSSATTQGQLQNILNDHNHEKFVYDVASFTKDANGDYTQQSDLYSGSYIVTLDAYSQGSSINMINSFDITTDADGILVRGELVVGDVTYKTGCYFNIIGGAYYMLPAYSYRVQLEDENETFKLIGSYEGKEYSYTRYINGEMSQGMVEASGTLYYDNNEFHQALRTISTFSESLTYGFAVPLVSATEATSVSLTAKVSKTTHVKTPFSATLADYADTGISCYVTSISRSTEVAGVSQTLYYATKDIAINGWNMKNVLVKIEEPFKQDGNEYAMIYSLKEATLA